jgi:hypothetical protein
MVVREAQTLLLFASKGLLPGFDLLRQPAQPGRSQNPKPFEIIIGGESPQGDRRARVDQSRRGPSKVCHSERSEESALGRSGTELQILRFAQDDNVARRGGAVVSECIPLNPESYRRRSSSGFPSAQGL